MTLRDNPIGDSDAYLSKPGNRFLEAAVEHLIPADEVGPGAREAGGKVPVDAEGTELALPSTATGAVATKVGVRLVDAIRKRVPITASGRQPFGC